MSQYDEELGVSCKETFDLFALIKQFSFYTIMYKLKHGEVIYFTFLNLLPQHCGYNYISQKHLFASSSEFTKHGSMSGATVVFGSHFALYSWQ